MISEGVRVLRRAVESDRRALLALYDAVASDLLARGIAQWQPGGLSLDLSPTAPSRAFVAEDDAVIVGAFLLVPRDPAIWPDERPAVYLSRLAVAPAYQGCGLGAWLLSQAEGIARTQSADVLRLDCWAGNVALQRFYQANGFVERGVVPEETWEVRRFEKDVFPPTQE